MEQANFITLTGSVAGAPEYSHNNHGRNFFSFYLEVERLSGTVDTLPVLVPEFMLNDMVLSPGDTISLTGQIRSYNNRSATGRRLVISVLADTLEFSEGPHENNVELQGIICKDPIYRRTPLGREICDIMLAVNRPYHRSDYLPCILWGRTAQEAACCHVGTGLSITGRMQSRKYIKVLDDRSEERTAYEISAMSAEITE